MDKYNEALEKAKLGLPIDEIFPELKESEDERIIQSLIGFIKLRLAKQEEYFDTGITNKAVLAWLEKQKEQKPDNDRYMEGYMQGISEQKPVEWTEEDEKVIKLIESATWDGEQLNQGEAGIVHGWLKSLRPQPHWKPSEEHPEMDLEKEIARFALNGGTGDNTPTIGETAHYFYELGLNARK